MGGHYEKRSVTFQAWFYSTDPQNIAGQLRTLSGYLKNTFRKRTSQNRKAPKSISDRKVAEIFLRNEHQFIPWRLRF